MHQSTTTPSLSRNGSARSVENVAAAPCAAEPPPSRSLSRGKWVPNETPIIIRAQDVRQRRASSDVVKPSRSQSPSLPSGACRRGASPPTAAPVAPAWAQGPARPVAQPAAIPLAVVVPTRGPTSPSAHTATVASGRTGGTVAVNSRSQQLPRSRSPSSSVAISRTNTGRNMSGTNGSVSSRGPRARSPAATPAARKPAHTGARSSIILPVEKPIPFAQQLNASPSMIEMMMCKADSAAVFLCSRPGGCGKSRCLNCGDAAAEAQQKRLGFGETPGWKMPAVSPPNTVACSPTSARCLLSPSWAKDLFGVETSRTKAHSSVRILDGLLEDEADSAMVGDLKFQDRKEDELRALSSFTTDVHLCPQLFEPSELTNLTCDLQTEASSIVVDATPLAASVTCIPRWAGAAPRIGLTRSRPRAAAASQQSGMIAAARSPSSRRQPASGSSSPGASPPATRQGALPPQHCAPGGLSPQVCASPVGSPVGPGTRSTRSSLTSTSAASQRQRAASVSKELAARIAATVQYTQQVSKELAATPLSKEPAATSLSKEPAQKIPAGRAAGSGSGRGRARFAGA